MRWCRDSIVCMDAGEERRLVNVVVLGLWERFIVGFMILERLWLAMWRWRLQRSEPSFFGVVPVADAAFCDVYNILLYFMLIILFYFSNFSHPAFRFDAFISRCVLETVFREETCPHHQPTNARKSIKPKAQLHPRYARAPSLPSPISD